jgi:N,N'-diacetyllegionaminate synthase
MSVVIIAEAGVNHNGDIGLAKKLIRVAADAGADYVKFQTFKADNLTTSSAQTSKYQKVNTGKEESQLELLKALELSHEDHKLLMNYAKECGIKFFSTAFDFESVDFLKSLNLGVWKIPSGEITNLPYLEKIAKYNEPTYLSTGMATMEEVVAAVEALKRSGLDSRKIVVLHCNSDYPTAAKDVNLRVLKTFKEKLQIEVGYSDHTLGIEVSLAAVALGAKIIEKHFTLDRSLPGPDHKASLTPEELKSMVHGIRNIELALGRAEKIPTASESVNIPIVRKSIVAKKTIKKGEKFTTENLTTKRPGTGISPMRWYEILGQPSDRDYNEDDLIL